MVRRVFAANALLILLAMAGCRTAPVMPPSPPIPPVTRPALPKTFGVVTNDPSGHLSFAYKDLRIAVDAPDSSLDFLLLTTAPKAWPSDLRKDLKIIGPADAAEGARRAGFVNAKALGGGQRLMLSKTSAFLFVSALTQRQPGAGAAANAYLLEFDSGRNLFVSGDVADFAPVREFVYTLRDDGKDVHLAFMDVAAGTEGRVAEFVSLIQPELAVLINKGGVSEAKLAEAFATQIFGGSWYVAPPSDNTPF